MKLELIVVPVSDIDRAKDFYSTRLGFTVDVDHRAGEDFRIVQLTPPGSACSITLMRNPAAGSLQGLHLVVSDIVEACSELRAQGVTVRGPFHFGAKGEADGLHPTRDDHASFAALADPDGNGWLLQEVSSR